MRRYRLTNRISFEDTDVNLPAGFTNIRAYLKQFAKHHPKYKSNAFLMMPFAETRHNQTITRAIRGALGEFGLAALRVDDREYAPTLWDNVCTYALGCKYGVAVFERSRSGNVSPNVAIELGFSLAHNKKVLILKDGRIRALPSDIVGRLYRQYDSRRPGPSIRRQVKSWAMAIGLRPKDMSRAIFKILTPVEEKILEMHFGVGEPQRNLSDIAEAFAKSKQEIFDIRKRAISKLGGSRRVRELLRYMGYY